MRLYLLVNKFAVVQRHWMWHVVTGTRESLSRVTIFERYISNFRENLSISCESSQAKAKEKPPIALIRSFAARCCFPIHHSSPWHRCVARKSVWFKRKFMLQKQRMSVVEARQAAEEKLKWNETFPLLLPLLPTRLVLCFIVAPVLLSPLVFPVAINKKKEILLCRPWYAARL